MRFTTPEADHDLESRTIVVGMLTPAERNMQLSCELLARRMLPRRLRHGGIRTAIVIFNSPELASGFPGSSNGPVVSFAGRWLLGGEGRHDIERDQGVENGTESLLRGERGRQLRLVVGCRGRSRHHVFGGALADVHEGHLWPLLSHLVRPMRWIFGASNRIFGASNMAEGSTPWVAKQTAWLADLSEVSCIAGGGSVTWPQSR